MKNKKAKITVFGFFKEIFWRYPKEIITLTIFLIISAILEAASIASIIPLLGEIFQKDDLVGGPLGDVISYFGLESLSMGWLLLVVVTLVFISELSLYFVSVGAAKMSYRIQKNLRDELMGKLFSASWSFRLQINTGKVINLIYTQTQQVANGIKHLGIYYTNAFVLILFSIFSLLVLWEAVALGLVAGLVVLFAIKRVYSISRSIGLRRVEVDGKCNTIIVENMNLEKHIKASHLEESRYNIFTEATRLLERLSGEEIAVKSFVKHFNKVFSVVFICVLFFVFIEVLPKPPGNLMFLLLLIQKSYFKFALLQAGRLSLVANIPSYEAVSDMIRMADQHPEDVEGQDFEVLKKDISFENLGFHYQPEKPILTNLNLEIKQSSMAALVGPSGGGKTTVVDLILGLLNPNEGRILIDGVDLKEIDLHQWRNKIGYVAQEPVLFDDTIRNNITIGQGKCFRRSCYTGC